MSASFKESLLGTKGKFLRTPTLSGDQQALMDQLSAGLGGQGLQQQGLGALSALLGGNQQFLEQLQAPALRQFNEQTIPGLAEQFSGAGSGAQASSAFAQSLGSAGAGLSESLASQRAQLGMQGQQTGLQGLMQLLGISQAPQFQNAFQPGTQGGLGSLLGGIGKGVGAGASGLLLGKF